MKKTILSLLLVLIASIGLNKSFAQTETGAKIEFAKETHDYGTIKNGGDPECFFEFKNTGDSPLIISNAKGSCGCTVPEWPKEPIAPGASAKIKVKYDTMRTGGINKSVTISSNAVNAPEKVIYITGTVLAPVEGATPINNSGAPANH